jgi:hypothetical protein
MISAKLTGLINYAFLSNPTACNRASPPPEKTLYKREEWCLVDEGAFSSSSIPGNGARKQLDGADVDI